MTKSLRKSKTHAAGVLANVLIGLVIVGGIVATVLIVLLNDTTGESGSGLSENWIYKFEGQRPVDPALLKWTEVTSFSSGFNTPRAIAVGPDDSLYVAGDQGLRIYSNDGTIREELALKQPVRGVAVDTDGTILLALPQEVYILPPDGGDPSGWRINDQAELASIAVHGDNIFVGDAGNRAVYRFGKDGSLLMTIAEVKRAKSGHLDVAMANDGLLRVTQCGLLEVNAYTLNGKRSFFWGKPGQEIENFIGCCNPVNIAVLPDGGIVTAEKGALPTVKVFHPDHGTGQAGKLESVVLSPRQVVDRWSSRNLVLTGDNIQKALDVAVDSKGRVVVLDPIGRLVRILERKSQ
ncbi:MAG: hypothetical protein ACLFVU_00500 [Phycisphaerae bacterium]